MSVFEQLRVVSRDVERLAEENVFLRVYQLFAFLAIVLFLLLLLDFIFNSVACVFFERDVLFRELFAVLVHFLVQSDKVLVVFRARFRFFRKSRHY